MPSVNGVKNGAIWGSRNEGETGLQGGKLDRVGSRCLGANHDDVADWVHGDSLELTVGLAFWFL